jgi:hypothetical protein
VLAMLAACQAAGNAGRMVATSATVATSAALAAHSARRPPCWPSPIFYCRPSARPPSIGSACKGGGVIAWADCSGRADWIGEGRSERHNRHKAKIRRNRQPLRHGSPVRSVGCRVNPQRTLYAVIADVLIAGLAIGLGGFLRSLKLKPPPITPQTATTQLGAS